MRSFIISAVLLALAAFPTALAAPAPQRGGVRPIPSRPIPGRPTTRPIPGRPTTRPTPGRPTTRPTPGRPTITASRPTITASRPATTSSRPISTSRPASSASGSPTSSSSSRPPVSTPSLPPRPPVGGGPGPGKIIGCPITATVPLPTNQTKIAVPAGEKVEFIGLGLGVQNYTCGPNSTFVSTGAVAQLYDVSCAASKSALLASLPAFALGLSKARQEVGPQVATKIGGGANPFKLGDHFFIPKTGGGIAPKFDFTASQKKSAFVVSAKKDGIAAPNSANVDWLQLTRVEGTIGSTVFRIDTAGGQPEKTCTPGTSPDVSIPYSANYYFTTPA